MAKGKYFDPVLFLPLIAAGELLQNCRAQWKSKWWQSFVVLQ